MFGTPERLALGAEASELTGQQCVEQMSRSVAPRYSNEDGHAAHGKIPSFYSNQAAHMRRLGAPAKRVDRRALNPCAAARFARFLTVLASVK